MAYPFFASDLHIGHPLLARLRGFTWAREMNEGLVARWNARVGRGDMVYCLGDIAVCGKREAKRWLDQLNGKIHLIRGNHDKVACKPGVRERFESIQDVLALRIHAPDFCAKVGVPGKELPIWLSHYSHLSWPSSVYGSLHFYGHSHGKLTHPSARAVDLSVEDWDLTPATLEEIVERIASRLRLLSAFEGGSLDEKPNQRPGL